jgi:hypothetical protein
MYAYSALIRELVQLNFLREGVQFLIRMDAEGVKMTPQVFNIVLHAYAKQGSIDSMRHTRHTPHATRHTPHATRHTPHATRRLIAILPHASGSCE